MIGISQPKNQTTLQSTGGDSIAVKYVLSSASAFVAEFVTYPLDLAKTRLQIQGEKSASVIANGTRKISSPQAYRGLFKTAVGIVKEEGFTKLWYGLPPALVRHAIYTGSRMTMYEQAREKLFHASSKDSIALWQATFLGMTCGGISQVIANPADVVKVMLQMEGRRRLEGKPPRVLGMTHAFQTVIAESGWKGLMRGWLPNMQRAALVNLGDLTAYDTVKHAVLTHTPLKDSPVTHALSSLLSGIVAAIFATPADVVKTRMMNQPFDATGRPLFYQSSLQCLSKTVREEGMLAIYKGFFPAWMRMGPWSMTFWLVYEQLRRLDKPSHSAQPVDTIVL
ncbi:mitochondrial uncoupling protein 4-like [Paramacrobiotus metropolitanus]|uniref:mitochondrial uncoupling protein 4-like n=1 Tax=Paramacrobiotus metropolitanus TaxID=2943436 RepID=UPI002445F78A|nr:mitochondrial uncoupling protein 4-like [Paramacrobiotus metropolitanus]